MSIGDKVKYKGKVWVVSAIFKSFMLLRNGDVERPIYKEFYNQLKGCAHEA